MLDAKPGDLFEWEGWFGNSLVIEYMGRNEVPPQKVQESSSVGEYSPEIGWLIFRSQEGEGNIFDVRSGGIRDGIGAWPIAAYSHYEEEGVNYIPGTLCIPPEKCGALNVCEDREL